MLMNEYKQTGLKVSGLGMGCMRLPQNEDGSIDYEAGFAMVDYALAHGINYFDTAYGYHGGKSEGFVGAALKRHPRESFLLASKMPGWMVKEYADVERIFQEQLDRCQVEYFDFYLCHALSASGLEIYDKVEILPFLNRMRKEGKIRRLGFSFHDSPEVLKRICAMNDWDFAQLQLNYLDWIAQDAKGQYEILTERGIPCVVMEPVRGGALAQLSPDASALLKDARPADSTASWAIRFAASLPNVLTVLSGMSNMEQMEDNVKTMSDFQPLSEAERETLMKALELYRANATIPCTGCRYCMDCPAGVDIPGVFKAYNHYGIERNGQKFLEEYKALEGCQADLCVSCGACQRVCPQAIHIPDRMKEIASLAAKL